MGRWDFPWEFPWSILRLALLLSYPIGIPFSFPSESNAPWYCPRDFPWDFPRFAMAHRTRYRMGLSSNDSWDFPRVGISTVGSPAKKSHGIPWDVFRDPIWDVSCDGPWSHTLPMGNVMRPVTSPPMGSPIRLPCVFRWEGDNDPCNVRCISGGVRCISWDVPWALTASLMGTTMHPVGSPMEDDKSHD